MENEVQAKPEMVEVTFKRALTVWWSWFWRTLALGLPVFLVLFMIIWRFQDNTLAALDLASKIANILVFIISYFTLQAILELRFADFQIVLWPNALFSGDKDKPIMITGNYILKIWGSLIWRKAILNILLIPILILFFALFHTLGFGRVGAMVASFIIQSCLTAYLEVLIMKWVFRLEYFDFNIRLMPTGAVAEAETKA